MSVSTKELENALYKCAKIGYSLRSNFSLILYQDKQRFYLDDYPDQKELREEYFKKEEKRNRYFYKRFLEVK